jgi:diguanylate cyclase (GGDEF)-like protein
VLLVDLDHFKEVNDTLGHPAGDALLQDLAQRLTSVLRECDTVARLGGDEFGIVLTSIALDDIGATAGRVHAALDAPFAVQGVAVSVGASVGVALAPAHGSDAATLVRHADVAMYAAKRHGSGYEIYDTATDHTNARRLSLAGELRKALETGEIVLHYQPNVDLVTGRVVSLEALARWQHPERGLLPASEFISAAEQVGLTRMLSRLALGAALENCAGWQRTPTPLAVAVNIDMRSLLDLELPTTIGKLLDDLELDPSCLDVEITESSIMADPVRVRRVALELADIGVPLVIDDFGTGYSSLSYLKQLPISKLKIDRSFVSRMVQSQSDKAIVRATVDLAHNLGLKVVAEGVEDVAVVEMLRSFGCDLAQGYFFGKPVPADEIRIPALASVS